MYLCAKSCYIDAHFHLGIVAYNHPMDYNKEQIDDMAWYVICVYCVFLSILELNSQFFSLH